MSENLPDRERCDFNRLTAQELSLQLMTLPAKTRLALVLSRTDAEAVVAALPVQDFFFFVKEIGPDDALPLLALGQVAQLDHLFDLEWWDQDHIQPAKSLQWLERLASASEEKLLAWLYDADFELLVTLFKKWIRVVLTPEDVDPLEAGEQLPKNTLDDQFFWETQYIQFEDFLSRLLSLIFEVNSGFYRELMNHVIWVSDAQMEEDAYRFHRARLEDEAIPDFYDALEIYRAMRPKEIGRDKDVGALKPAEASTPSFAVALLPKESLLQSAFAEIHDPRVIDTLRLELASLANKVVIADKLSLDEPEAMRGAVDKVAAQVNLGLDVTSQGSLQAAVKVLEEVFLENLFRLAHTQTTWLRGRLRQVLQHGWLSRWPAGLNCLENDWMEAAELLLQKTPRLVRPVSASVPHPTEDFFRDRRDLSRGKHFVQVVSALGPVFDALAADPAPLGESLWQEGQIRRLEDLTLGIMIRTAAAQVLITGEWEVKPLSLDRWAGLFRRLGPAVMEQAIRSWVEQIVPDELQRNLVETYLAPLFEDYARELSPFSPGNPPDPRLVKFFIFAEE